VWRPLERDHLFVLNQSEFVCVQVATLVERLHLLVADLVQ